ncbi:MAG TPA: DUF362 domain-containing protein [Candidatus Hydrogenedentes bacterium]|nr:DUF362 domain-containing protein [Candidatus Hydrogenedentota bacterium]
MSTVAVVGCPDYDEARVAAAVDEALALLGGAERFARPGERLLLKPNLLAGAAPEKAVTTHPAVFKAVARRLAGCGATLAYGDSPGFGRPESAARRAGLGKVAEELGIPFADFVSGKTISFPEGRFIKQFTIAQGVLDADAVVSLPKLKTHALTRVTGAIKNQFGCITGLLKGEFHARLPDLEPFARMLVDLNRFVRPRLYVMDAVVAMEGNGPRGGTPRPVGVLMVSEDPVALDATACRLVNLDPQLVPTIRAGVEMGLGACNDIELVGAPIERFTVRDFKVDRRRTGAKGTIPRIVSRIMRETVVPRPVINTAVCTRCGTCVKVCPLTPKAVDFTAGQDVPPRHDYRRCIRCYCCQEYCPDGAITVHTPLLGRVIHG